MPPARRVAIAMEMSAGIRDIALAGIRDALERILAEVGTEP